MTISLARLSPVRLLHVALVTLSILLPVGSGAHAARSIVDMRSNGSSPAYFVAFTTLTPKSPGADPSTLAIWGDPTRTAKNGTFEMVGLISPGSQGAAADNEAPPPAASYFGTPPESLQQALSWTTLISAEQGRHPIVRNALIVLVDEDAYRAAYAIYGGERKGTYFEDQTVAPGDGAARAHGIAQVISYFAGVAAQLGQKVPDTLNLASMQGDDPSTAGSTFSPEVYLQKMISTAIASRELCLRGGCWSGDAYGDAPNGQGFFSYLSGATYYGEMHRGKRRGRGFWQGADGTTINGLFDGDEPVQALVTFPDGDSFSGGVTGQHLVQGTYRWRDGTVYEGSFDSGGQLAAGTLMAPGGTTINIVDGQMQSSAPVAMPSSLPRPDRLSAYSLDFSR